MNKNTFMSSNMNLVEKDYPDLYETIVNLNDTVYSGTKLDQKTQKLIAIAIAVGTNDDLMIQKQMKNAINQYGITKDEIMDVLRVALLLSGKPAFTKSIGILYSLIE